MDQFETYEDLAGKWRWRLISAGGKIVASSGESFDSHGNALRAARAVQQAAGGALVSMRPGLGAKAMLRGLIQREERWRSRLAGAETARPQRRQRPSRGTRVRPISSPSSF